MDPAEFALMKPWERLEARLASDPSLHSNRLSFPERCGAFYALHRGFSQIVVARAFGVTQATMSLLSRALHSPRYNDVAAEFKALGAEQFRDRYYTVDIDDRIAAARQGFPGKTRPIPPRRPPSPKAGKYAGPIETPDGVCKGRIYFTDDGWTVTCDTEGWTRTAFNTSTQAYDEWHRGHAYDSPRRKDT